MRVPCAASLVLLLALAPAPAEAQFGRAGETRAMSRVDIGAGVAAGLLVGSASDFLDGGTGVAGTVRFRVGRRERLSLRGDVAWIPLKDDADEGTGTTSENTLLMAGGGPEIALALGWVEPYLHLFGGMLVNYMEVSEADGFGATASEKTFGWGGGAGLRVLLAGGRYPVSLDVGGALLDFGEMGVARSPGTTPLSGGGLQDMLLVELSMIALTAGGSVGIF